MYSNEGVRLNDLITCPCLKHISGRCMPGLFCLFYPKLGAQQSNRYEIVVPATSTSTKSCFVFPIFFSSFFFFFNSHPGSFTEAIKNTSYEKQKKKAVSRQRNVSLYTFVDSGAQKGT